MTIHGPVGVGTETYLTGVEVGFWGSGRHSIGRDRMRVCGEAESPCGVAVDGDSSRRPQM